MNTILCLSALLFLAHTVAASNTTNATTTTTVVSNTTTTTTVENTTTVATTTTVAPSVPIGSFLCGSYSNSTILLNGYNLQSGRVSVNLTLNANEPSLNTFTSAVDTVSKLYALGWQEGNDSRLAVIGYKKDSLEILTKCDLPAKPVSCISILKGTVYFEHGGKWKKLNSTSNCEVVDLIDNIKEVTGLCVAMPSETDGESLILFSDSAKKEDIYAYNPSKATIALKTTLSEVVNILHDVYKTRIVVFNQNGNPVTLNLGPSENKTTFSSVVCNQPCFVNDQAPLIRFVVTDEVPELVATNGVAITTGFRPIEYQSPCNTPRHYVPLNFGDDGPAPFTTEPTASSTVDPGNDNETDANSTCFIATAAFGTPMDASVWQLRQFRDQYLVHSVAGRVFLRMYYENSPPVAQWIAEREWARAVVRVLLRPLVSLAALLHYSS